MNYEATHMSLIDGSLAMWTSMTSTTITLVNEDGFEWTDPLDQWLPIPDHAREFIVDDVEEISRLIDGDPWRPVTPYDDEWENGYLPGSGENAYDDSYIDYLNRM